MSELPRIGRRGRMLLYGYGVLATAALLLSLWTGMEEVSRQDWSGPPFARAFGPLLVFAFAGYGLLQTRWLLVVGAAAAVAQLAVAVWLITSVPLETRMSRFFVWGDLVVSVLILVVLLIAGVAGWRRRGRDHHA